MSIIFTFKLENVNSIFKTDKKTTIEKIDVKEVSEEKWVEYFEQLYKSTNSEEEHQNMEQLCETITTLEQFKTATTKRKSRRQTTKLLKK